MNIISNKYYKRLNKRIYKILLFGIVTFIALAIYLCVSAIKDYKWSSEYIEAKKDNWIPYAQGSGKQNPFYVYTLFNPPLDTIGLFNKKETKLVQGNIIYVEDLLVGKEIGTDKLKEEKFSYLINCDTYESGWYTNYSSVDKNNIKLDSITWLTDEGESAKDNYKKICGIVLTHKILDPIIQRQKEIVHFYTASSLEHQTKIMIFYELMGPLGGLDPIAKPTQLNDVHSVVNALYGYNYKAFDFPSDELGYSVTAPVRYEYDFDEEGYFAKNKSLLETSVRSFQNDPNLSVLSLGYSSNYRINNYFGDDIRNYYWKVKENENPIYSIQIVNHNSSEYQTIKSLRTEYDNVLNNMKTLKVQSVYKCENKIIFIIDGLADNGFGLIYNANSSNEVNCGVLLNRFRIKKDIRLDENWRYWFAK